jgi:hypothetical protein
MMSMTASGLTINKALLDHNGEVTLFDGNNIQDAINAAEDGDVIYLTLGTFKPFNVTKQITIKGTGETSIVDGDVKISIPNSPTLSNPVLETLKVSGSVKVTAPLTNLVVRQCKVTSSFGIEAKVTGGTIERCPIGTMSFTGVIQDLTIDRCNVGSGFALSSTIESMTVVNSYINSLSANSGATNNTTFANCNLYFNSCSYFSGTIINSIVGHIGYDMTLKSTVLVNSLINKKCGSYYMSIGTSSVLQNCYTVSVNGMDTSTSTLQANGYLGTDGTVVGMYGGDTPYDANMLVPSVPKVTSSDIKLDNEKKELNVKLTVSPQ